MVNVKFLDWTRDRNAIALTTWFESAYWVAREEQVWIHGTRYEVVRVEHTAEAEVSCFVRAIN